MEPSTPPSQLCAGCVNLRKRSRAAVSDQESTAVNFEVLAMLSAGGLASILHCDRFCDLRPASAKVKCLQMLVFFIHENDVSGANHINDFCSAIVATHGSAKKLPSHAFEDSHQACV